MERRWRGGKERKKESSRATEAQIQKLEKKMENEDKITSDKEEGIKEKMLTKSLLGGGLFACVWLILLPSVSSTFPHRLDVVTDELDS